MSNSFYNYTVNVASGTTIRSDKKNTDNEAITTGFDLVEAQLGLRLMMPDGFEGSSQLPALENSSVIYITATGELGYYSMATFDSNVSDVEGWHSDVSLWKDQVATNAEAAALSAAAAAGYAATVGVPPLIDDGGTFSITEEQSVIDIFCLGDATIIFPETPGVSAQYSICSLSETAEIPVSTNGGDNDHVITFLDGTTDTDFIIYGQYKIKLIWLPTGEYKEIA